MKRMISTFFLLPLGLLAGCGSDGPSRADETSPERAALLGVKRFIDAQLASLHQSSETLVRVAPQPMRGGWTETPDPEALRQMREAWLDARNAYERVEGAIAILFPDLDVATDERYDGFILEQGKDANLFDDEGVVGIHAVERILWANQHPPEVVAFESGLDGYVPASFPLDETQASDFKNKLVARLVRDTGTMQSEFSPLALDVSAAYRGVIGSMMEQREKVGLAASGEAESRYANHTLGDMRANLAGGRQIFALFEPWLVTKPDGLSLVMEIQAAFDRVEAAYGAIEGDGLPPVPAGWNPVSPSPEHLTTSYGRLFELLERETRLTQQGALVALMTQGAELLGVPVLPQ